MKLEVTLQHRRLEVNSDDILTNPELVIIDFRSRYKGDSGVHVGNSPTEYDEVWIDPEGDAATAQHILADNGKSVQENLDEADKKMFQLLTDVPTKADIAPVTGATSALRALFVARGAVWNETTGFYELNGLTDITEQQMLIIYLQTGCMYNPSHTYFHNAVSSMALVGFRTNFQMVINTSQTFPCLVTTLNIEVYNPGLDIYEYNLVSGYIVYNCPKLRSINGVINCVNTTSIQPTYSVPKLETIKLKNLKVNFSIHSGASLSYQSIMYMVNNSANASTTITITLHPTALARLSQEDIALASSRNITLTA